LLTSNVFVSQFCRLKKTFGILLERYFLLKKYKYFLEFKQSGL